MSETKGIKTGKGRATTSTTRHGDLAELLAAVLQHPDIPTDLHTHIGDWLVSQPQERVDSPEYIRRALRNTKKGGRG